VSILLDVFGVWVSSNTHTCSQIGGLIDYTLVFVAGSVMIVLLTKNAPAVLAHSEAGSESIGY
jgi:zinc transporter ZupT